MTARWSWDYRPYSWQVDSSAARAASGLAYAARRLGSIRAQAMSRAKRKEKSEHTAPLDVRIKTVRRTPEQETAVQKMLATPCPYCSDPAKYQRALTAEGQYSHTGGIAPVGKFWARDENGGGGGPLGMVNARNYDHGEYWRILIGSKHFIPRFKDFTLEIINFASSHNPFFWTSDALLFRLTAAPPDIARHNKFGFPVTRITHKKSPVTVDAHTWFNHGTILTVHHVPKELTSADVTVMQEALELFRPETRGAPKIKRADFWQAIDKHSAELTQARVADELNVSQSTLSGWLKRERMKWSDVQQHAASHRP